MSRPRTEEVGRLLGTRTARASVELSSIPRTHSFRRFGVCARLQFRSRTPMLSQPLQTISDFIRSPKQTLTAYHRAQQIDTTDVSKGLTPAPSLANLKAETMHQDNSLESKDVEVTCLEMPEPNRLNFKQPFIGWRLGVVLVASCASVVFVINLAFTIVGMRTYDTKRGILVEGECGSVKSLNKQFHLLINVLSTILLSGSNYCMQCLSAPTRKDIDRAHATKKSLDIGVLSYRNLTRISRKRFFLWMLLGLSSLPIHLL